MGADFTDHVITDRTFRRSTSSPLRRKDRSPADCYLANDGKPIAAGSVTEGLPSTAVCFAVSTRAFPLVPDVWMRLLARVEGSVLWLSQ